MDNRILGTLIGNEALKKTFGPQIESDRVSHAYILDGRKGSGKHTAARLISAAIECEHRHDSSYPLPCGQCSSCRKILSGNSVDVMTVSNGDKATLGVEKIREMKETLYYTPNDGDKKFYFIENAELMTPQAQNALLLSLEEPPSCVIFFLLSSDSTKLLPTILSRAPVIRMEKFDPDFIEEYLISKNPKLDRLKATEAAHMAGGALGMAEELVKSGLKELKQYDIAEKTAEAILSFSPAERLLFIKNLPPKDRIVAQKILSLTKLAVRDIIAGKKGGDLQFYRKSSGIPQFAKGVSVKRLIEICAALSQAEEDLAANCSLNTVYTSLMLSTQKGK